MVNLRGDWEEDGGCEVMIYIMDGCAVSGMLVCGLEGTFWNEKREKR